jgi:hypothetical protein
MKKLVPRFLPEVPPVGIICLNYPILLFPQIFLLSMEKTEKNFEEWVATVEKRDLLLFKLSTPRESPML